MPFRLVVWNCSQALHSKYERLAALEPDVAIVPECAEPDVIRRKSPNFLFGDCEWRGTIKHKGLGVFAFKDVRLRLHHSWEPRFHIFLPLEVTGAAEFNLLAVWAFHRRTPETVTRTPATMRTAIEHYASFLSRGRGVLAGDLNANVIWDASKRYEPFVDVDASLRGLGLVSAYHAVGGHLHGKEPHPTLFWQKKAVQGYHIDYSYIPAEWTERVRSVSVGSADDWLPYSDHAPLIVELDTSPRQLTRAESG